MKDRRSALLIAIICLCLRIPALGQDKTWETYNQSGDDAITKKQYADAEAAYREALKLSEKLKDKDPRIAVSLIKLAESLSFQSKRDEAEPLANRALVALEAAVKTSKSKDPKERFYKLETSVMVLDKAAAIFVMSQKYTEAEPLYQKVIALREDAVQPKESPKSNEDFLSFLAQTVAHAQAKLAEAYDKLARFYATQRRFEEAEPIYIKALKAWEAEYGADKPPAALGASRLATLYAMQGKFDKAEPLYSRAISIFESSHWFEKPEVATTFENYSRLLRQTGREAEAAAMLERAKAIRDKLQRSTN